MTYSIGEKPGMATYRCTNCRWEVTLGDRDARLPPCANCGRDQHVRYERIR